MYKSPEGTKVHLCDTCLTCKVRGNSILKPCSEATLLAISHFKAKTKYKKGESIFQTGEPYRGVFLIKYGVVKLERVSAGGRPFIVKIVGNGGIIGHRERNNKFIQHYSATALSEVECCFIPAESFKEILKNSPDLENQIGEEHLKDLAMLEQKTMNLAYQSVREKIADALLLITEVYNYSQTHKSFCIDLSRQDISNLTGTTKEQVSATLKDFARSGIIKYSGKSFYFIQIDALKEIIGER